MTINLDTRTDTHALTIRICGNDYSGEDIRNILLAVEDRFFGHMPEWKVRHLERLCREGKI